MFYNPIQQFNRDLSVLAIKAFGEDLCERRRVKHLKETSKHHAKKQQKRKLKGAQSEEDHGRALKLRKVDEDTAVSGTDALAAGSDHAKNTAPPATEIDGDLENGMPLVEQSEATEAEPAQDSPLIDHPNVDAATASNGIVVGDQAQSRTADEQVGDPTDVSITAEPNKNAAKLAISEDGESATPTWQPKFRILDALSATGLRALRYAQEIPFATAITANDMDRSATKSIKLNVEHNKLSSTITVNTGNALAHMYSVAFPHSDSHGANHISSKYDVIDLDPYGTAAPFIDSALQALNDGGMLCVTYTDSGVFASCGYPEKTYSLYGGMPVKGPHSHEGGLRIILHSVAAAAARYGLAVEPLLCLSIDFYVRLFIRVNRSPADVKFLAGKSMLVYGCDAGCGAWTTQALGRNVRQSGKGDNPQFHFKHSVAQAPSADRRCEHCGSVTHVAGPMWAGPLHNGAFVGKLISDVQNIDQDVYQTKSRIEGMLDTALEELCVVDGAETLWSAKDRDGSRAMLPKTPPETLDSHPFFFIPSAVSKVLHCVAPSEAAIKGALRHAGYKATRSHCKPGSVKTDAPWSAVWEVMREWVRQRSPIKEGALKPGSPGWKIMQNARSTSTEGESPKSTETEASKEAQKSTTSGVTDQGSIDAPAGIVPDADIGAANPTDGKDDIRTDVDRAAVSVTTNGDSPEIITDRKAAPPADGKVDGGKRMRVVFDEVLGKDKPGKRLVRYQQNPRDNWGPMSKAKGSA